MKDWSGKKLCFECIKSLSANINIGLQNNGRCQRCHRVQTIFTVTSVPLMVTEHANNCPECAHSDGVHANACPHSEIEKLKKERDEIVHILQLFGVYQGDTSLPEQLEKILQQFLKKGREEDRL